MSASAGAAVAGQGTARISGVVTALVTPLTTRDQPDLGALEHLIERQIAAGVDAIFVLGSVGEGPLLPDAVYAAVARHATRVARGRLPVLGGASDNSLERCGERLSVLADAGIDAAVATLPYYGWPGRHEDSVRFFTELTRLSPLPLVAYNLPKAVGWQMPPETLESLFTLPKLVCIKDTHGDAAKMVAVASSPRRPPHVTYLPGNSALAARLLRAGADGVVSTPANILPEVFVTLVRLHRQGRHDLVQELDEKVMPFVTKLLDLMPTGAAAIKGLLSAEGIGSPATVAPWPVMDTAAIEAARPHLEAARSAIAAFNERLAGSD